MMLKMLQADDNIATKLNFTADEIDEFINLWKQGNPRISQRRGGGSHGVTEEAQRELDDIVARIKERIRAADGQDTEPEAQIPGTNQIADTADEVRHVEAEQVADKANDDKLFDSEALLKYAEENNIEDKLLNEVLKHIEDGEALTAKLKAFVKKRVEETQQKLLANLDDAMTEANISWKDIETYVDKNTSFLSVFKKEIDAAIARRTDMVKRRGGKSFYELVEERDGITATQLQEYFDGEEALGADAYAKLCVYTTMGCSEDIMRAVEQMLIVHRKALSDSKVELEIKDYLTDKNQQEWLELAYLVFDERYEQVIK